MLFILRSKQRRLPLLLTVAVVSGWLASLGAAAQSGSTRSGPYPLAAAPPEHAVEQAAFTETEGEAAASITQSIIEAKTKEVTADTTLDEAARKDTLERLKAASEWLKTADEATEKAEQFQADILTAPDVLKEVQDALAAPRSDAPFQADESMPLKAIEQAVSEVEERLKQAKETLAKREETIKRRTARKAELTKLIPETEKLYEEAKKALTTAPEAASQRTSARRYEAETRLLALERQRTLYPLESKRIDTFADVAPLQRDLAKRDVESLEKEAARWQQFLADSRKRDSDRQAAEARRQLQDAEPALKTLAQRNAELADRRKTLVALIEQISKEVQDATATLEKINEDYAKMEDKVQKAGNSTTVGLLLRRQRDQLPALKACRERLRFVNAETPMVHLSLLTLKDEQEAYEDREGIAAAIINRLQKQPQHGDESFSRHMVDELLDSKEELLTTLASDHDVYLKLLAELEVAQQELFASIERSLAYIDERVLWIRSSDPMGPAHFGEAWEELQDLGQPAQWLAVLKATWNHVGRRPLLAVLAALVVALMLLCRRRFRQQVNRICETDEDALRGKFSSTIEAIVAAGLATAFWPGLMWLAGWQLQVSPGMPALGIAVGTGFQSAAYVFWLCQFASQLCRNNGIAERHFAWSGENVGRARRNLSWLTVIGVPCVFFLAAVTQYREGEWSSFLGRVGFLVGMAALVVFAHATLRIRRNRTSGRNRPASNVGMIHLRQLAYLFGIGVPCALALLVALGYDYSAQRIAIRLQATLSVLFAVSLARAVAVRWLIVRRFRLEQKRLAAQEAAAAAAANDEGAHASEVVDDSLAQFDKNDSELRYLLRYAVTAAFLIGTYLVWSDVTPALGVLDQVVISSKSVEVKQTVTAEDGTAKVLTSYKDVKTTLKHAILAGLLLGMGLVLSRNLPALFDVLVLERMPIDVGQRYAAGMIFRYSLTVATVITACLVVGLSWSSIQWLAAAMTVGLGFGLQEIFANLVSGVIILFERPIRVGDLVTVGGVDGRVTRMQIRATTITSFDRRELIIPNKKFITEDVMNWTLSDDINRVVIEVGVAYGSDTERARQLLLDVARRQPLVMSDPEPLATFDRFADSSLNFTLRCFLPNLENRLAVIHELHSEINREFAAAQIEIAFPQQDLHVRSIDTPLHRALLDGGQSKDAA